jgi:uncharacterized protein (TIRG00374 family)
MKLKNIKKTAQWVLVIVILAYVVWYFSNNTDDLRVLKEIKPIYLVWIFALEFMCLSVRAFRTQMILEFCSEKRIKYLRWFQIFTLGAFLNTVAPQAGFIYRSLKVKELFNISYTQYIASFLFFTWLDTWINFTIATIVFLTTDISMKIFGIPAKLLIPIIALAIFSGPFLASALFDKFSLPGKVLKILHAKIQELLKKIMEVWNDRKTLRRLILWGLIAVIPKGVQVYIVFLALGQNLDFPALILIYVLIKVSQLINITPGNLGVQEILLGYVCEQAGIGMAEGLLASIILRIAAYAVQMSLGLLFGGLDLVRNQQTKDLH